MSRFQYLPAIGVVIVSLAFPWLWSSGLFSSLGIDLNLQFSNSLFKSLGRSRCEAPAAAIEEEWNHFYHLGGNGPWVEKTNAQFGTWEEEGQTPDGCVVDQVHIVGLARNLVSYSDWYSWPGMQKDTQPAMPENALLSRLDSFTLNGSLSFLNNHNWTYFVPGSTSNQASFENLTTTTQYAGTLSAFTLGTMMQTRYRHLLPPAPQPLHVFTCSSPRDIETALYFTDGLLGRSWSHSTSPLARLHIIPESPSRGGNTLTPGDTCLSYGHNVTHGHDLGYERLAEWQAVYTAPIIVRLSKENPDLNPPPTPAEVYSMMEMCGFEHLARGQGKSPWCAVFTQQEWEDFEYGRDILHFYRAGPGNRWARVMGMLWIEATAKLLSETTEKGKGRLYASFVHDGDIIPVLAALGLFDEDGQGDEALLPTTHRKVDRRWKTSDVVPMAGRIVVERLQCRTPQGWGYRELRLFVNDGWVGWRVRGKGNERVMVPQIQVERFRDMVKEWRKEIGGFGEACGLDEGAEQEIDFLHQDH